MTTLADVATHTRTDIDMLRLGRLHTDLRDLQARMLRLFAEYEQARAEAAEAGIEFSLVLADHMQAALSSYKRGMEAAELAQTARELVSHDQGWPQRSDAA